jgi:hypothetical protein
MLRHHGERLDRLTVIFPNKRAGLFLSKELSGRLDRPTWLPGIVTLEEFIERHTGLKRAADIALVIKLYHSYRACSGSQESFDDFYAWGNMLLEDFDDVDKYLVDAKDLFSNLHALHEIERAFPYLTAAQVALVRRFWSHFQEGKESREQRSFLQTWDRLYPTYLHFKEKLQREGICYEGMGARLFCDRLDTVSADERLLFAGFNALNRCEEKIFSHFRDNGQATFYWDHDLYYTGNEAHEAGLYLRENLKRFPNALGTEHFNNFRRAGKRLEHVSVPSDISQAKALPTLLDEFSPSPAARAETAIVLCDENLLLPVLHSIPPTVEKINITMGYPARETAAAALLPLADDLQRHARQEGSAGYYPRAQVIALLNHPLVQATAPEEIRRAIQRVHAGSLVHVPAALLHFNEVTRVIFTPRATGTFDYFLAILAGLLPTLSAAPAIEREVLFALYKRLQQARDTFREEGIVPGERLHARVVDQLTRALSIPFSGEPLEGMQVMGLLETRMLDFKKLVILSANEGIIPREAPSPTFIPYNLRAGFGLPTPGHRDAIYAYHFYRLLQRAEEVKILHASVAGGGREKSRFLYQIEHESDLPVHERHLGEEISTRVPPPVTIGKNEEIKQRLERYSRAGEGISPTALNAYLDCRLKFYFKHVAGIREKEQPPGELDHRVVGNIFHETARTLYLTFPGGLATAAGVDALARDEATIERHARAAREKILDNGIERPDDDGAGKLALSIVKKQIKKVLEHDQKIAPFTILSVEERYGLPFPVAGGSRTVYIEGSIDRVDRLAAGTRVIDYKTGIDKGDFKSVESLFDPDNRQRNKAAFQAILYCLMYAHARPTVGPLLPALYSTRALFAPRHDYRFLLDGLPVDDIAPIAPAFRASLTGLLDEIFSPDQPFTRTTHDEKCPACPYNAICAREQ